MPTTIRRVAEAAGTSPATVSHVLNGTKVVSPELRERVLAAAQELNYRPNAVGRNLRRRSTSDIGLVVPHAEDPFYATLLQEVEDASFRFGMSMIACVTNRNDQREAQYIESLACRRVAGVILVRDHIKEAGEDLVLSPLREVGIPIVAFSQHVGGAYVDRVIVDQVGGAREAVNHLLALGHRRVGCLSGFRNTLIFQRERNAGWRAALRDAGIDMQPEWQVEAEPGFDSGLKAARTLVEAGVTAVLCATDAHALGLLRGLTDMGRSVPGDMSVVGFDDLWLTNIAIPRLTTVAQPLTQQANEALGLIRGRRSGLVSGPPMTRILQPSLTIRASTGPVPPTRSERSR